MTQTTKTSLPQKILLLVFALIAIEILLQLVGAGYEFFYKVDNVPIIKNSNTRVILCLGESTTAWGMANSYPSLLQQGLDAKFGTGQFLVVNEGVAATDSSKILISLDEKIQKFKPDIIITMIGINDFWSLKQTDFFDSKVKIYKFIKLLLINLKLWYSESQRKPALEEQPATRSSLTAAGRNLLDQKDFVQAEFYFRKAIELAPTTENYFGLANAELELGKTAEAENNFYKFATQLNTAAAFTEVGNLFYFRFGVADDYGQKIARKFLEKALLIDPNYIPALKLLGCGYANNPPNREKALIYLQKAYALGSTDSDVIGSLADIAIFFGKNSEAEKYLKTGLNSKDQSVFFVWQRLIRVYISEKKFEEANECLEKFQEQYPGNQSVMDTKDEILKAQGLLNTTDQSRNVTYRNFLSLPATRDNYASIAKKIEGNGIRHVVMQYPLRGIDELKEILKSYPKIIFVENSKNFEKSLQTKKSSDLFIDKFAGDFGHFTPIASQLIAEQLLLRMGQENLITQ